MGPSKMCFALELFCKKAFQREGGQCPPNFVEFSHGIVKRRGGLPLVIVVIAGLFSTKAKVISKWSKVLDSLSSEFETNLRLRSIIRILSFNYHDLPYNLKACFLYFRMFPEDYAIDCGRLTRLWIAEGFVKEKKGLTSEDVAQDNLNQLILKSLVQVDEEDFIGRIRLCRVHGHSFKVRGTEFQSCLNDKLLKFSENCLTPLNSKQCKYSFAEYY